jgi:tricorn protease
MPTRPWVAGPGTALTYSVTASVTLEISVGLTSTPCAADFDLVRKHWSPVSKLITDFEIAPDGKQALFTARGDVYTVRASDATIRNLTRSPGVREKYATWSPNGKWVAYISDRSGEDELYIVPSDGTGAEQRITFDGRMFRLAPVWSPDSTKLLFADRDVRLWYVDIQAKKPVFIDAIVGGINLKQNRTRRNV